MLIYKGKTYSNRKELVKEIGAYRYKNLLKFKDKDLIINNNIIESYELQKNNGESCK